MLTLSCTYVRRELSAYHDEELPVADRIAIADHLRSCPACAVEADDLVVMGEGLRASSRSEEIGWMPRLGRLQSDMIEWVDAEEKASLGRQFAELFVDARRASMCIGASVVASVCMLMGTLLVAQGPAGQIDSLKAMMTRKVRTYNIELPAAGPVELPRANTEAVMPAAVVNLDELGDGVSAFSALITSDGTLEDLEVLMPQARGPRTSPATRQQRSALLNAAATARFEPARVAGSPVSLNVVWLLTHRTVRPHLRGRVEVTIDGFRL
ncbi:MAG: zf-HC2 domain-containing protein [Acidobacteria bacterium]|nr:zf-HC2 domain-containing protein [Acidobacteriota bacterium]